MKKTNRASFPKPYSDQDLPQAVYSRHPSILGEPSVSRRSSDGPRGVNKDGSKISVQKSKASGSSDKSKRRHYENIPEEDEGKSRQATLTMSPSSEATSRTLATDLFAAAAAPPMDIGAVLNRDDRERYKYGWGSCTPDIVQNCCLKPRSLLVILCLISFAAEFGIHGAFKASSTELQREYDLDGNDIAFILLMFYVGYTVATPFIAYFGTHSANKARWIASGSILVFIGASINVSPAFYSLIPHHHGDDTATHKPYCNASCNIGFNWSHEGENTCQVSKRSNFKYVFMAGSFIYGLGSATPYTMGIVFLDEHVSHRSSPVFTGLFHTFDLLGPVAGYTVSGTWLKLQASIEREQLDDFDRRHRSLRAWWIPIVFCALWALIAAFVMFGFPEKLAGENRAHMRELMEDVMDGWRIPAYAAQDWTKDVGEGPWALIKRIGILIMQPTYTALVVERILTYVFVTGFSSIIAEYIEKNYAVKAGEAAMYSGGVLVGSAVCGLLAGTFVQYKFSFGVKGNLRWALFTAVGCFVCSFAFVIQCSTVKFVGVSTDLGGNFTTSWDQTCNRCCHCGKTFQPMCFKDGKDTIVQFYSACYAGCLTVETLQAQLVGNNCSCVAAYRADLDPVVRERDCIGRCPYKMFAFLLALAWCALFMYMHKNSTEQAMLRFVPFKYRLVGKCFLNAMGHLLGSVPAVNLFAFILHRACLKSEDSICGSRERCIHYDQEALVQGITVTTTVISALVVVTLIVAVISHMRMTDPTARTGTTTSKPGTVGEQSHTTKRKQKV